MSRRKNNRKSSSFTTQIDITPLVDLTFILLIVFMLSASVSKSFINLPKYGKGLEANSNQALVFYDVKKNIYLQDELISKEELHKYIQANQDKFYSVEADSALSLGSAVSFLEEIRALGVEASLVSESSE